MRGLYVTRFALPLLVISASVAGCSSPEQRAQAHYENGAKLLAAKEYVKAGLEFKNALQLQKEHVAAWRGLSQVEEHDGNWDAVGAILRTVVELDPKDVESRLRLGRLLVVANALDEATKIAEAAQKLDPRNSGVLALRAAIQLKVGDAKGSIRLAQQAIENDPGNMDALMVLAAERMQRSDFEGALKLLSAPPQQQNEVGLLIFKVKIYERMGNQAEIESVLRQLVDLHPKEPAFSQQLVKFYLAKKDLGAAEAAVRQRAKVNPGDAEAALDVVRFLNTFKDAAAARSELEARISQGGDVFAYQLMLAELERTQGNVAAARQRIEEVTKTSTGEHQLTARIKLAELAMAQRDFASAEPIIGQILTQDARNGSGLKLRASVNLERGKFEAAINDLREALHDQPRATDAMLMLAIAYERSGQIELADRQYTDALRTANFDPAMGLNYVSYLIRRGSPQRAEEVVNDLLTRSPTNGSVWGSLAQLRLARQDWAGAQEAAEKMRKLGADPSAADQLLAAALRGQQKFDESVAALQTAYDAAPGAPRSLYALVSGLMQAGQTPRAATFVKDILEKDPNNLDALILLATIDVAEKRPDAAITNLQLAIERQPKSNAGYRALADLYVQQGKFDDAQKVLQKGLQTASDTSNLELAMAGVYEHMGNIDGAIATYEKLALEQPGSMVIANNLASLLSDYRSDPASLTRAQTVAASLRKSNVPQFMDTLGWLHYRRGEYKEALPLLEEAVRQLPTVPLTRYHLAMTYAGLGDHDKANDQLTKALQSAAPASAVHDKIQTALQSIKKVELTRRG